MPLATNAESIFTDRGALLPLDRINLRFMVTFAKLALEGDYTVYIESYREIEGRGVLTRKSKWKHRTTDRLKNVIAPVLILYSDQTRYENFKITYS